MGANGRKSPKERQHCASSEGRGQTEPNPHGRKAHPKKRKRAQWLRPLHVKKSCRRFWLANDHEVCAAVLRHLGLRGVFFCVKVAVGEGLDAAWVDAKRNEVLFDGVCAAVAEGK